MYFLVHPSICTYLSSGEENLGDLSSAESVEEKSTVVINEDNNIVTDIPDEDLEVIEDSAANTATSTILVNNTDSLPISNKSGQHKNINEFFPLRWESNSVSSGFLTL